MQSFVCKHKINWNRFQPQTPWKSLRSYTSSGNNNLKHFLSGSVHSRFFATQSRGPIPLKKDPKFNAYFGVAHPSYWKPPLNITITGSSGQIGYNLLGQIASGEVFGKDQPVHITMLECHETDRDAYGVIHEIRDGTYPLLLSVQKLQSEQGAFDGADYVIMAHSKPATEIQDETLRKIYNKQEEWDIMDGLTRRKVKQMAIDFHNLHTAFMHAVHIHNMASWNVKIFVISNPVARMCNLVSHFVPRLEEKFITGLSRTHHNRFTAMLAREFQCRPSDIQQTCVWGSTTDSYIPDFTSVLVKGRPIHELVKGDFESWKHRMIDAFLKRDTEVESLMKDSTTALANDLCVSWRVLSQHPTLCVKYASERPSKISPVVSATSAAIQHLQDWVHGTNGRWTSMVVSSDNHYGIEPGQYASMPVVCEDGEYKIIENLQVEPWLEHRLKQHYEIENTSSGQDLEDFIEYSKWMIDLVKRDEAQKPVSFPSPEDVSKMDEETQKMLRRRITLLNPQEAILHDREWYPEGFEVTSSTGIVPPPKLTKKIKNKRKRRKLRRKKPFNKFPDTWSTTGQDLDVIPLLDQPINTAVFTEEDEFFMFDYRKALLHGAEPKEWWPKYLEFKEKTKDPKGLATVYESMLESLLEIETKTGTKIFTPDQLEEHRKKIEEIRNTPSQVKQVQDTFNPLEQAMIPQSMTPENLPQQPAVLARSTQAPQKPTLTHRFVDTDHIPYDSYGKPHPEYGPDEDEEEASKYDIDAIGALEKWRNPPLMSPYPEKPTEKDQKDLDAEKLKQTELEEERRKAIEEQQEKMDEEEEKEEEELGEQQQFVPTFWIREFEKEVDPWKTNPDEKFEDFLAPQHRFVWDLIQEAKAKGLSEVRQEIKMSPEDFEFMKKQRVPKTDIIDLSYIPKEGVPLRNVPKDEDGEVEETEQPK